MRVGVGRFFALAGILALGGLAGCGGGDSEPEGIQVEDVPALEQSVREAVEPFVEDGNEMAADLIVQTQGAPTSISETSVICQIDEPDHADKCLVKVGITNAINGDSSIVIDYDMTLEDDEKCWTGKLAEVFVLETLEEFPAEDSGPGVDLSGCL